VPSKTSRSSSRLLIAIDANPCLSQKVGGAIGICEWNEWMKSPAAQSHFAQARNERGLRSTRCVNYHRTGRQAPPARRRSCVHEVADDAVELLVPHCNDYRVRLGEDSGQGAVRCGNWRWATRMQAYKLNTGPP
jgi:hypothetical protein